jgi:hypothetical protein
MDHPAWPEKESPLTSSSEVKTFWWSLAVFFTGIFVLILMVLFQIYLYLPPAGPVAMILCCFVVFVTSTLVFDHGSDALWPQSIRHAADGVLSDVPNEPLIQEGAYMHSKIRYELINNESNIIFRPIPGLAQSQKNAGNWFLLVFSIIFLPVFSCGLHLSPMQMPPLIAVTATVILMSLTIGPLLAMFYFTTNLFTSQFTTLIVPASGPFAELDVALPLSAPSFKTNRQTVSVPRDQIAALQLCPYSFPCGDGRYDGLQGLLVQKSPNSAGYQRYVLLNCSDKIACSKMMEQLAKYLRVPFLFGADAEGWKEEEKRVKNRPELSFKGAG